MKKARMLNVRWGKEEKKKRKEKIQEAGNRKHSAGTLPSGIDIQGTTDRVKTFGEAANAPKHI